MDAPDHDPVPPTPPPEDGDDAENLRGELARRVVGQPEAIDVIVPSIRLHESGLAPPHRPVGVFLLLGPTGTGKTRTVEALAEVLHGEPGRILKIDCGEFQSEHEVAKLIGAPPGYVGHAETRPFLTQDKLDAVTSEGSDLSLVLFDEIEKAAPSVVQLLLGVLDKAVLRLGTGATVDFQKSLIFLTSNLGAREMMAEIQPTLGFEAGRERAEARLPERLAGIASQAVRKRFSPEFVNRIDAIVTYRPLDEQALKAIVEQLLEELRDHVRKRLGDRAFEIEVSEAVRLRLLEEGASPEHGARELKRTIHRRLTQPLASLLVEGRIRPGARVTVDAVPGTDDFVIQAAGGREAEEKPRRSVLVVDDNEGIVMWLRSVLVDEGWDVLPAFTCQEALSHLATARPDAALLDYVLPDGDGLELGVRLRRERPGLRAILMTGLDLREEEAFVCRQYGIPVLIKPFLLDAVLAHLEGADEDDRVMTAGGGGPP